jgi:DNA-binding MarR family transcriptional regulator
MPTPDRDLVTGVIQLANLLMRHLAPVFEKAHVTPQQWAILAALAGAEHPLTLAGLARTMLVSKQNMTGMVARLEELGLVERQSDPSDLRSSRLVPTRRGHATVDKLRPAYEAWQRELGADIAERDLAALTRTVDRLIGRLQSSAE